MKKYLKVFLLIFCLLSLIRTIFNHFNYENIYNEYKTSITGIIVNFEKNKDKTIIDIKNKRKYRITVYDDVKYEYGDKISVTGTFFSPSDNTVFNLFNYRKYLLSKNIYMLIKNPKIKLISKNKNIFYKVKEKIQNHISNYKSKAYLKAFLLGDLSELEADVKKTYQILGVSHLMAISGMHVSTLLAILNYLLKRFKHKNIIIFLILIFYLFLTNFAISLQRSLMFLFLKYINKRFDLNTKSIYILIITIFLLLFINPFYIYNVGFLFSSIISFFIIILNDKLLKVDGYLKRAILLSTVCFLASVPILALYFFKINVLSIFFNVLFIPIISLVIFPFCILTFILSPLDNVLFLLTIFIEEVSSFLLKIRVFNLVISKPNIIFILIYYLSLFLAIKVEKKYIIIFVFMMFFNINSRFFIMHPEIVFLDVGQGDCEIVILPKGKTVMIDTGGSYYSKGEITNNKIIPYLNSRGINEIECLILTHGDYDHMGEAVNLVNNFKVEKVIFNCGKFNELEKDLIKVLDRKRIPYYSCIKELYINENKLYFLNNKDYDNENDNSSVIYTKFNNHKFLFMGDAGVEVEQDLANKCNLKDIDFLKVGHHGSNTSSSEEFIDSINIKTSLISVGKNNRYGHPKAAVLDTLKNSKIYRTDLDGSIKIKLNKNEYKISTCPP